LTTENFLTVPRTARYFAIREAGSATREVWFALHGYGQLAASFAHQCEALADPRRLVLVPEALSRFYLGDHVRPAGPDTKIGASWMTREDREHEIQDYVHYLDILYARVFNSMKRESVSVHVLGFSQGTATATRWVTRGNVRADRLIIWGAPMPNDLDPAVDGERLRKMKLVLVAGNKDQYITSKVLKAEQARLTQMGVPFRVVEFEGGHAIDGATLQKLAQD